MRRRVVSVALLVVGWMAIALLGWAAGTVLPETTALDDRALRFVVDHRNDSLDGGAKVLTKLGDSSVLAPAAIVATLLAWRSSRRSPLAAAVVVPILALVGSDILQRVLKQAVQRPRPPVSSALSVAPGFAFPSGHATKSTAVWVASALALVLVSPLSSAARRALLAAAATIALVVGCTRVYLGVHWVTDVLGGWLLGGLWAGLLAAWAWRDRGGASRGPTTCGEVHSPRP